MDDEENAADERGSAQRRGLRAHRPGRVARQLARRRRRERLAGVMIAVLGVAVLIVAFLALRNPRHGATAAGTDTHHSTAPAPSSSSSGSRSSGSTSTGSPSTKSNSTSTHHETAIGSKPLIVLNQTTTPNLARDAASRFRTGGWKVDSTQEGYQNDVITTTAYYDPSIGGAERAAQALRHQYSTIHRVTARFAQLPAGPVVVVLTGDYTSS